MWALGITAYGMAVFDRSSLGVASLQAQERFHATAAVLSLFAVLQLAVYAAMQIPVGVVLDRFGTRRLVVAGGPLMGPRPPPPRGPPHGAARGPPRGAGGP